MIDKNAQPGRRALRVVTATGATDAPFEITAPLPRAGRFQGFTPDDGIYLIIPVRFADGDSANKKEPVRVQQSAQPVPSTGLMNNRQ
ncbi:MAG: hypothetical protein H0V27_10555 [Pyrinomonadaceae bacterium]|nr:hypothetical protein [Pyrinomonadaceae bacterium]